VRSPTSASKRPNLIAIQTRPILTCSDGHRTQSSAAAALVGCLADARRLGLSSRLFRPFGDFRKWPDAANRLRRTERQLLNDGRPTRSEALRDRIWALGRTLHPRVSSAEYFQSAFGQKADRIAIEPQWLFRLVRIGRGRGRRPHPLIHGLETVSFARMAPANQHEGAILRRVGGSSQWSATYVPKPMISHPILRIGQFMSSGASAACAHNAHKEG
jgi:hypothetical protein